MALVGQELSSIAEAVELISAADQTPAPPTTARAQVADPASKPAPDTAAIQALREERDRLSGEVEVLRKRLREEISLRADSVQRVEALEAEQRKMAGDVLGADVKRQRRGIFRRTPKAPVPRSLTHAPRPGAAAPAGALGAHRVSEELESVVDRRLFGP
jgi:hypothetical protein